MNFRYVFKHNRDGDYHYDYFTLNEIENGKTKETIAFRRGGGYRLISRDEFIGLTDSNGRNIYKNDVVNIPYNEIGSHIVSLENGAYNISKYNTDLVKVVRTRFEKD